MASNGELDVRGRRIRLTTLDRIYFPQTATTKNDLLGYYIQIADVRSGDAARDQAGRASP